VENNLFNPGMRLTYQSDLRCEIEHLKSGVKLVTDAPPDNQGRGESFSPTDLLCTSLASCMVTLMGIAARSHEFQLNQVQVDIEKKMTSNPRKVAGIILRIRIGGELLGEKQQTLLRRAAETCPVMLSIHPDIRVEVKWEFPLE